MGGKRVQGCKDSAYLKGKSCQIQDYDAWLQPQKAKIVTRFASGNVELTMCKLGAL